MTLKSWIAAFFPVSLLALIGYTAVKMSVLGTAAAVYLLPVLAYRLLILFYPISSGLSNLKERRFSPWWASHQIQLI